tara:strand:- start:414 stop:1418 length:1005 start_codon:yes stop_codon:yes gene_type:complete
MKEFHNINFYNADYQKGIEWAQTSAGTVCLEQGKKAPKILHKYGDTQLEPLHTDRYAKGVYFYLWSKPLTNYYHTMLDAVGCLTRYYRVLDQHPNCTLLVNGTPRMGLKNYPPFVAELLDLLDIRWEFTDPTTQYEHVYFGDTGAQDANMKRQQPGAEYWHLIDRIVNLSEQETVPRYEKIYLSRRAHANPMLNRKDIIGEDNTVKRGLVNEDQVVDILTELGYTEVFGENYTLPQKVKLFNQMHKYISAAGAGVTNPIFVRDHPVSVGGIHTPGFPFPGPRHGRHVLTSPQSCATIDVYPGKVVFEDPQPTKGYNHPWRINNLVAFRKWAATI